MKIRIEPQLKQSLDAKIDQVKAQFIAEEFASLPEDAARFEIEDMDEWCVVYPEGNFCIRGMYHCPGEDYRIHYTNRKDDRPWVEVIIGTQVYSFRSMPDAIAFCKNYRSRPSPEFGKIQAENINKADAFIRKVIDYQIQGLSEEDRALVTVNGQVEFRVDFRMERELTSLSEAVAFLKTGPEYI